MVKLNSDGSALTNPGRIGAGGLLEVIMVSLSMHMLLPWGMGLITKQMWKLLYGAYLGV